MDGQGAGGSIIPDEENSNAGAGSLPRQLPDAITVNLF